jgi:hypothetical protein
VVIHPEFWSRRRLVLPGSEPGELPSTSRGALEGSGFQIVEGRSGAVARRYVAATPARSWRSGRALRSAASGADGQAQLTSTVGDPLPHGLRAFGLCRGSKHRPLAGSWSGTGVCASLAPHPCGACSRPGTYPP